MLLSGKLFYPKGIFLHIFLYEWYACWGMSQIDKTEWLQHYYCDGPVETTPPPHALPPERLRTLTRSTFKYINFTKNQTSVIMFHVNLPGVYVRYIMKDPSESIQVAFGQISVYLLTVRSAEFFSGLSQVGTMLRMWGFSRNRRENPKLPKDVQ